MSVDITKFLHCSKRTPKFICLIFTAKRVSILKGHHQANT